MTESQVAEEVARLVAAQTGRDHAIDGNYVSKLERGVITWPNRAYRQAFRVLFHVLSDVELGFYPSRTRKDAERWLTSAEAGTVSVLHAQWWTARAGVTGGPRPRDASTGGRPPPAPPTTHSPDSGAATALWPVHV